MNIKLASKCIPTKIFSHYLNGTIDNYVVYMDGRACGSWEHDMGFYVIRRKLPFLIIKKLYEKNRV